MSNMFFGRWYKVTEKLPLVKKRYVVAYKMGEDLFMSTERPFYLPEDNTKLQFNGDVVAWCEIKDYEE
jgi:hypothetical protein